MTASKKLPPLKKTDDAFEKAAGVSVDVVIRLKGGDSRHIARYIHNLEQWQVSFIAGAADVAEWWPLPTGKEQELAAMARKLLDQVLPQAGGIVLDIGLVNNLGILCNEIISQGGEK